MKNLIIKHNVSAFHAPEQFILHPYAKKCVVIYHVNLMIEDNVSVLGEYCESGEDVLGNTV